MNITYTTADVAKLLHVAPQVVAKWFDSGRLRGYRVPGDQTRMIPKENLVRFLEDHSMPIPDELFVN